MAYEQKPKQAVKGRSGMVTIELPKSGDEGADSGLISHYEGIGYTHKETKGTGTLVMECPVDVSQKREADAIALHHRRSQIADKPTLDPGAKLVTNTVERLMPQSVESLLSSDDEEPDLD